MTGIDFYVSGLWPPFFLFDFRLWGRPLIKVNFRKLFWFF